MTIYIHGSISWSITPWFKSSETWHCVDWFQGWLLPPSCRFMQSKNSDIPKALNLHQHYCKHLKSRYKLTINLRDTVYLWLCSWTQQLSQDLYCTGNMNPPRIQSLFIFCSSAYLISQRSLEMLTCSFWHMASSFLNSTNFSSISFQSLQRMWTIRTNSASTTNNICKDSITEI